MRNPVFASLASLLALSLALPGMARAECAKCAADNAHREQVRQLIDDYSQGNMDAVLAALSDDVVSTVYGSEDRIALHGTRTGKAAVKQWFADVAATFAPDEFAVDNYYADGDTVVVLMHEAGTALPTGKHYSEHEVVFFTFTGDKISRVIGLDDSGEEIRALTP